MNAAAEPAAKKQRLAPDRFLDFQPSGRARAGAHFYGAACADWEAYRARGELQRTRFTVFGYLC